MSEDVYRQHLEKLGEDVVRHRLANRMAIGDRPENNPPYEFVHIWLGATVAKRRRIAAGGRAESELPTKVIPPVPSKD